MQNFCEGHQPKILNMLYDLRLFPSNYVKYKKMNNCILKDSLKLITKGTVLLNNENEKKNNNKENEENINNINNNTDYNYNEGENYSNNKKDNIDMSNDKHFEINVTEYSRFLIDVLKL